MQKAIRYARLPKPTQGFLPALAQPIRATAFCLHGHTQRLIDAPVYELYDLTEEEIATVEGTGV